MCADSQLSAARGVPTQSSATFTQCGFGTVNPTRLDGIKVMPRHKVSFTLVLLTIFSITDAVAASPQQAEESAATEREIGTSPTEPSIGRYAMTAYQETLVLLDTATGNTWLLKASADAGAVGWSPIQRELDSTLEMLAVANAATDGRIDTKRVPELGVIMLKGSRKDVEDAKDAIRQKEKEGLKVPRK